MNLFEMARKAMINDWIDSTPQRVRIDAQMDVIRDQAEELAAQTRALRDQAEALMAQICCNGRCNQGRDCPLRK